MLRIMENLTRSLLWVLLLSGMTLLGSLSGVAETTPDSETLPEGFVYLDAVDATIVQEMRYATDHNFLGRPVKGYESARCILSEPTARALAQVQASLKEQHLSLKVYDCYRPQTAVNDFVEWGKNLDDQRMKAEFYPRVEKRDVFPLGYIMDKSGHSRGSTVDLTLVPIPVPKQGQYRSAQHLLSCIAPKGKRFNDNSLEMGTGYDCFDPLAHTMSPDISATAHQNRRQLKSSMEQAGFKNLREEWWHYTLRQEPFPQTYFDFPVK